MLANFATAPQGPAAGSVPFLKLMGILRGGWQLARAALVVDAQRQNADADTAFIDAKQITARFFGEHLLPQVPGLAAAITGGADSALALDDAAF